MSTLLLLLFAAAVDTAATSHAETTFDPPYLSKVERIAQQNALPAGLIEKCLDHIDRVHFFEQFEGKNAALAARSDQAKGWYVADGFDVNLASADVFGPGFESDGATNYVASLASADAFALRLKVDLSRLATGDEVYVIDTSANRAFGPYTAASSAASGRWLATTVGESCLLVVRSTQPVVPDLQVLALSHFFTNLEEQAKALSCNIDIECETDQAIQESSSGIGMLIVPQGASLQVLCSGSLINNSDTVTLEPYFLTSWHCVPDAADATQVEVVWDWRMATCGGSTPPSLSTLPRSDGVKLLRTSSLYDITLMSLDTVPSGDFGRAYLGWETRAPVLNEDAVTLHFSGGSPMRITYGSVVGINQASNGFLRETKAHWNLGVTEGGSSGGPLLLVDSDFAICGTLSNGTTHSCSSNINNVDWFSSFRDFFPTIQDYLTGSTPPDDGGGGGGGGTTTCPASTTFKADTATLDDLRAFRDKVLKQSWAGSMLVDAYYAATPFTVPLVEHSAIARGAFRTMALPAATAGRFLR